MAQTRIPSSGLGSDLTLTGTTYFAGNILPTSNNTVNIGSPDARFGTLYISANTIDLGGAQISATESGSISFATATGNIDLNANTVNFLSTVSEGTAGPTGYTGSRGTDGVIGVDGYTGSRGANGEMGYTGSKGSVAITIGNTTPVGSALGDLWYRESNDTMYRYMVFGTGSYWIDITGPVHNFGVSAAEQTAITESGITAPSTIEYLVVAGGGAGGGTGSWVDYGGGGGGGGLLTGTASGITSGTTYPIVVGAGGAFAMSTPGANGSTSSWNNISTVGGGGGGRSGNPAGKAGGSGGGAGNTNNGPGAAGGAATAGPPRQGFNGGSNDTGAQGSAAGGGGGAGAPGVNGVNNISGLGGNGVETSISGTAIYYAGGGGGNSRDPGLGGGDTPNRGGGGRGDRHPDWGGLRGTSGGSGVVILRYADTFGEAISTTGSPTITVTGGYRIYTFTSSGSITF